MGLGLPQHCCPDYNSGHLWKDQEHPSPNSTELMEIRYDPMVRTPVAVTIMMILIYATDFIGFKLVLGTFFGTQPLYTKVENS